MKIHYIGKSVELLDASLKERQLGRSKIPRFSAEQAKNFEPFFKFLNDKDRDILYLIFVNGKRQSSVRHILKRSQPSLYYDICRIKERLKFIYYLYSVFDIFLDFIENRSQGYESELINILVLMFYTTSFTCTAMVLKKPQLYVRYRFEKALKKMETLRHWDVYEIFFGIRSNLNIVKRIYKN